MKRSICMGMLALYSVLLCAIDLRWITTRQVKTLNGKNDCIEDIVLEKDMEIKGDYETFIIDTTGDDGGDYNAVSGYYQDKLYWVPSNALKPAGTTDVIADELLSVPNVPYHWLPSSSIDILRSKDRETARRYEPVAIETFMDDVEWYESVARFTTEPLKISNVCIDTYGLVGQLAGYCITNIVKTENGYDMDAVCNDWRVEDPPLPDELLPEEGEPLRLLMREDGDYLSLYINGLENKLCTYVKVSESFYQQWKSLMLDNTCDLSNVVWPRYGDGTSEYADEIIRRQTAGSTYRTIDNLRLRAEANTTSGILATLEKGTRVKVLRTGDEQIIDGITANWVGVELEDGTQGWCFGGFLSTEAEDKAAVRAVTASVSSEPESRGPDKGFVNMAVVILTGIVLLISLIIILVLIKRKKKDIS